MITWQETCAKCYGRGHWLGPFDSLCRVCDGIGRVPIAGAPGFGCPMTLADREPGDIVVIGTGDRVRVQWHQPRKTKKQPPSTTFVSLFDDDFGGGERESNDRIPLPSTFGVLDVIESRAAGDASEGRGDDVDPIARRARGRGALL